MSICVLILLLATAARFHDIEVQSLWNDEGNSYRLALRSLPEIASAVAADIHSPFYYDLLHVWVRLVGETEFALRSLSAFFSILSVALAFSLGKRLYGPVAGLAASAFVALNTFSIYYAQEARMYSMLGAVGAAGMWAFVSFIKEKDNAKAERREEGIQPHPNPSPSQWGGAKGRGRFVSWWFAFGLVNAVGLYTHYSYAFVMLAQGVMLALWLAALAYDAIQRGEGPRGAIKAVAPVLGRYVAANLLTLLLFLPWLPTAIHQLTVWPNVSAPVPMDRVLREIQGWLAFGSTFEENMGGMGAAVYFLLVFGLLALPAQTSQPRARWRMLLPVVWVLASVLPVLYLEFYLRYLKFLLPAQIGFALWMGRGIWVLWTVRTRERVAALKHLPKFAAAFGTLGLLVNMAGGLDPLYTDAKFRRDDYRGMAQTIMAEVRPGDAVILDAPNQAEVFNYYYRGGAPVYSLPTSPDDSRTLAETREIIAGHGRIFALLWGMAERDPNGVVEGALNREAFQVSDVWYGDVRFVRYVTPVELTDLRESGARFGDSITLQAYALSSERLQPGDVLQVRLDWTTDAALDTRYKVFLQLLNPDGTLAAQRDAEPAGGQALTTTWLRGETVTDNHALVIPADLPPADYSLIVGLYGIDDPQARLPVGEDDYLTLVVIHVA